MSRWKSFIDKEGTPCSKCNDHMHIEISNIRYSLNRARNAVNHVLLRGLCPKMHTSHICPHCYQSHSLVRSAKTCFESHILNGIIVCPSNCTTSCKTYQQWISNHYMHDPNFIKPVSMTKNQQKKRIRDEMNSETLENILENLNSLRESPFIGVQNVFEVECPSRLLFSKWISQLNITLEAV